MGKGTHRGNHVIHVGKALWIVDRKKRWELWDSEARHTLTREGSSWKVTSSTKHNQEVVPVVRVLHRRRP